MPFTYQPFDSRLTASIGELIAHRGDPAAQAAIATAQAHARAAEASGRARASIGETIGNGIQGITQQIEQNRLLAPRRELEALQINSAKQSAQDDLLLRQALSMEKEGDLTPGVQFLQKQGPMGVGALQKLQVYAEHKQAQHDEDAGMLGFEIFKGGGTPDAVKAAVDHAVKAGKLTAAEGQQFHLMSVEEPDRTMAAAQALMGRSDKFRGILEKSDDTIEVNGQLLNKRTGQPVGAQVPKQATPLDPIEAAYKTKQIAELDAKLNGTVPLTAQQKGELQIQRDRLNAEIHHWRNQDTAANPFGMGTMRAVGGPAGSASTGPTGDDFLKTLSPQSAAEIKAYATGRLPFPQGMSQAKLQPLIQAVTQYDPTFEAANYNARNKARTDLTSPNGTGGKTINALNTAIQHAGKLSDLIEKLDNSEYPVVNSVVNPLKKAAGNTAVTNFQAVAPQLAKEIERAWRGTGGSTSDIQELIDSIGKNLGKQQQREALQQFVELAMGKLSTTEQQRDNALGPIASKDVPVLFEQSKAILERIGSRAAGSSGTVKMRAPNGQEQDVSPSEVEHYKALGASVVK